MSTGCQRRRTSTAKPWPPPSARRSIAAARPFLLSRRTHSATRSPATPRSRRSGTHSSTEDISTTRPQVSPRWPNGWRLSSSHPRARRPEQRRSGGGGGGGVEGGGDGDLFVDE